MAMMGFERIRSRDTRETEDQEVEEDVALFRRPPVAGLGQSARSSIAVVVVITVCGVAGWAFFSSLLAPAKAPLQELSEPPRVRASSAQGNPQLHKWPQPSPLLGRSQHVTFGGGANRFTTQNARSFLLANLDEFLAVYNARPNKDEENVCGIRINHAFAIFMVGRLIQPTTIIESGINTGMSTYMFRAASPRAHIISFDTQDEPICGQRHRWLDHTNNRYLTGRAFRDFAEVDWSNRTEWRLDPRTTLFYQVVEEGSGIKPATLTRDTCNSLHQTIDPLSRSCWVVWVVGLSCRVYAVMCARMIIRTPSRHACLRWCALGSGMRWPRTTTRSSTTTAASSRPATITA